jgi:hypothetical protein
MKHGAVLICFITTILFTACNDSHQDVLLVIPDNFTGSITIKEVDTGYDSPYAPALENYQAIEYSVGDDTILKVKDIAVFNNFESVTISYENVTPVNNDRVSWNIISERTIELTVIE